MARDDDAESGGHNAIDDIVQSIRIRRIGGAIQAEPAANAANDEIPTYATAPDWHREHESVIRKCQIMKSALFNAGKRLEHKHASGQFTFAVSGVYGFLVPLFTLQFEPYFPSGLVSSTISFTAATAGLISFAVAMLYQQQDLPRRARRFYEAGRRMNKLAKDLKVMQFTTVDQFRRVMHHYDEILADCENHDEIDYEFARLGYRPRDDRDGRLTRWKKERRRLDIRFIIQTYSLILVVWILPPAIALWTWSSLSK